MCTTDVDRVSGDPETTVFKIAARLHQARWREARALPIGTQPIDAVDARPFGCRLPLAYARESGANFLDARVLGAVRERLANPERHQMLDEKRLYADLLSSMPMCFNVFGTIIEPESATRAVRTWWPDVPGRVSRVAFEWSPGRNDNAYLGNRTSFDVAFLLDLGSGRRGILAVETKYHEHPIAVGIAASKVPRYREVARGSGLFNDADLDELMRGDASQVWLDHLLALSMLQHASGSWHWARFVTVYPDANPSWTRTTGRYRAMLRDDQTFATSTFDELVDCDALEPNVREALVARYRCWQ